MNTLHQVTGPMGEAALRLTTPNLVVIDGGRIATARESSIGYAGASREMYVLGALMIALQILDGVLTGIGVSYLGVSAEGNLFLRSMMEQIGYIQTLVIVKLVAVAVVAALCILSAQVDWIRKVMKVLIVVYLTVAVIPWTAIIVTRLA
jgi:hypothetical protein